MQVNTFQKENDRKFSHLGGQRKKLQRQYLLICDLFGTAIISPSQDCRADSQSYPPGKDCDRYASSNHRPGTITAYVVSTMHHKEIPCNPSIYKDWKSSLKTVGFEPDETSGPVLSTTVDKKYSVTEALGQSSDSNTLSVWDENKLSILHPSKQSLRIL